VVGNHGLEPWQATEALERKVKRWRAILEREIGAVKGVEIEDKIFSLAVHYRRSREKKKARKAIYAAVQALGNVHLIGGKLVMNVLPRGAPHKGMALLKERDRLGCDTAIYLGDDETDEDVFALDQPGQLLAVRVGVRKTSLAPYFLRTQTEIDRLLRELIKQRVAARRARAA
jgi:trehalose 6-phosphate phosphatase